MTDVFILSAARSAIGTFNGSLKGLSPTQLGVAVAKEAMARGGIEAADIDHAVFGNVIPNDAQDLYLARTIALGAGMPESSQGLTLNRLCGSGAQSIISATQMIMLGDSRMALAGGAESMNRAPYAVEGLREGRKMGDGKIYDWLSHTLSDPFGHGHMGCTAENIAEKYQISRERQDEFAVESQSRALRAIEAGYFAEQIVGIELKTRKGSTTFDTDEHPRASTLEDLAKLKPAFREGGSVTAGNASGINDGAAAVILAHEDEVKRRNLEPLARIVSWGIAGVPPELMGLGPIEAVPIALKRAGLSLDDIDVIESNEAFAAQSISVADALGFDPEKVNPNGGAIALGHPLGATGSVLTVKALYELARTNKRYGLVTMCIGGGQGIALVVERLG